MTSTASAAVADAENLVIGCGGAIGGAVARQLLAEGESVIGISRHRPPLSHPRFEWLPCPSYAEIEVASLCETLSARSERLNRVVIATGMLHDAQHRPERRLESVREPSLMALYRANAVLPQLWLSGLLPRFVGQRHTTVAVLSARVGSIEDNRLGGWYGYRAAKAALNMLLQCTAIELARRAPGVKLIAYHPGTVISPLSEPFAAGRQRLTPEFSAQRLLALMAEAPRDGALDFFDWNGARVLW
ncbi:SDR family NAD(P)-dependent oxidoreductase [Ferrimonas balearica]|uniref:SDR family NAD(P)-dependent oxidoreductase n=1 Tax=Ferrimonas balearica TaxID=44012 RepID=UPI001C98FF66|nr:SDR family NAD(P)-dependent oxidoreductase [Ferrimonas balearica]MBY5991194.1 SDR family NAD(P)-dependent oxidoreductase [Ferrimonas balearica]